MAAASAEAAAAGHTARDLPVPFPEIRDLDHRMGCAPPPAVDPFPNGGMTVIGPEVLEAWTNKSGCHRRRRL